MDENELFDVVKDLDFFKEFEENEIKMTKNIDDQNISRWQKTAINKFLLAVPPRFKSLVKYRNWKSAMIYLSAFKKSR